MIMIAIKTYASRSLGTCGANPISPNRLLLSRSIIPFYVQGLDIRRNNIVIIPDFPRLANMTRTFDLSKDHVLSAACACAGLLLLAGGDHLGSLCIVSLNVEICRL